MADRARESAVRGNAAGRSCAAPGRAPRPGPELRDRSGGHATPVAAFAQHRRCGRVQLPALLTRGPLGHRGDDPTVVEHVGTGDEPGVADEQKGGGQGDVFRQFPGGVAAWPPSPAPSPTGEPSSCCPMDVGDAGTIELTAGAPLGPMRTGSATRMWLALAIRYAMPGCVDFRGLTYIRP